MNEDEEPQKTLRKYTPKERADGEGSVYQTTRGNAKWCASYTVWNTDDETGEKRRSFVRGYGATKPEAIARRAQNLHKRLTGATKQRTRDTSPTLNAYTQTYLTAKATETTPETWRKIKRNIERHILPHLGNQKMNKITEEQLNDVFYNKIKDEGPSAKQNAYKDLNSLFNFAMKRKIITENPLQYVVKPKKPRTQTLENDSKFIGKRMKMSRYMLDWLESEESGKWHAHFPRILFMFMGLRRAELLGLRWSSINQLNRKGSASFVVNGSLKRHEKHTGLKGWYLEDHRVKSEAGHRTIYLPERWRKALIQQKKNNPVAKEEWQQDLVFLSEQGTHISYNYFDRNWRKMLLDYMNRDGKNRTQLTTDEYFRPHATRHIAASMLFKEGIPPEQAKELLGHSEAIMTLYYTHFTRESRVESSQSLERAFDSALAKIPIEKAQ